MDESVLSRRQATLFYNDAPTALTHCRRTFNPVQAALIPAHVTLCREDEVSDWNALERRIASLRSVKLRLEFGRPVRSGNSVLLPATNGIEDFAALRRALLPHDPRPMNPHVTIIHPRNGICTDEAFAEIERFLQPFPWTFREISLIEQRDGGPWKTLTCCGNEAMTEKTIDEYLVEKLRSMFKEGRTIEDMCTTIWSELEVESGNAMTAVIYFIKAFGLSLADARLIEGSPICGAAAFSVELVESQLRPKMLLFRERKTLP